MSEYKNQITKYNNALTKKAGFSRKSPEDHRKEQVPIARYQNLITKEQVPKARYRNAIAKLQVPIA